MRVWSLHPCYLDSRGLVALWRETLLARSVLVGKTRGYRNHPQLVRFRNCPDYAGAINSYLCAVYDESVMRGYAFDIRKLEPENRSVRLPVAKGQIDYEWKHLMNKLARRDTERYSEQKKVENPLPHPLFYVIDGPVEKWEKMKSPTGEQDGNN